MRDLVAASLAALSRSSEGTRTRSTSGIPGRGPHRGSRWILDASRRLLALTLNASVFVGLSLGGGLLTAWHFIENGTSLTTMRIGPWTSWVAAGRPNPDPYTRAHHASTGRLPEPGSGTHIFQARTDNEGAVLRTSCEYFVVGRDPSSGWWSLALFDQNGRLIRNPANRFAFNRDNVLRGPDGTFRIVLARQSRGGSWLPTGTATSLNLVMTLTAVPVTVNFGGNRPMDVVMPEIRRGKCR